jgi:hypothetical protein
MDPDKALELLRAALAETNHALAAVNSIGNGIGHEMAREDLANASADLIDTTSALVGWLDSGGFLPKSWTGRGQKSSG